MASLSLKNAILSARVRLDHGTAGLAFRIVNANTYYAVGVGARAGEVVLYRVLGGTAHRAAGAAADVRDEQGISVTITADGDEFAIDVKGNLLFRARDEGIVRDGKIAAWKPSGRCHDIPHRRIRPSLVGNAGMKGAGQCFQTSAGRHALAPFRGLSPVRFHHIKGEAA